ncbi:MAG: DUF2085 domain-containing protein [Bellilinea sp.]
MIVVTLYVKRNHPASEQAKSDLEHLSKDHPHQLAVVDIQTQPDLEAAFDGMVPVAQIGPYRLQSPFTRQDLKVALGAAADRSQHLNRIGDTSHTKRVERGHHFSGTDRFSLWLSQNYMGLISLVLIFYVGLPFLAPVLAKTGAVGSARVIYTMYSPLCHQLPYRSWFLYGTQPYYPRELAGIQGVATYEEIIGADATDVGNNRKFIGVEELGYGAEAVGYKVALCQRDIAIYGSMALFSLLFWLTGRKIKPLPWFLWLLFGLVPIGIDGVSQLPSLISQLPDWMIIRESTPILRTITGALFGITTSWYLFPMIEESMRETRKMLAGKKAVVSQIQQASQP